MGLMFGWVWINISFCLILYVDSIQYVSEGYLQDPWIQPLSVLVNSDPSTCNVTVLYNARGEVHVHWTIDGFSPKDLDGNTAVSEETVGTEKAAKVSIPFILEPGTLRLHLISVEHAYEVHLELDIRHGMADVYADVLPYTLFVPSNIGISQLGQTQFPVYVNTSGGPYMFGMLQADLVSLTDPPTGHVDHNVAYSFLPELPKSKIGLVRRINRENTYHADVALNSPTLYQNGGIISVMAACSTTNSIVKRLDIKQLLYLKPKPTTFPVANNSVGFVPMADSESTIHVVEGDKALIRCRSLGNPAPSISLLKNSGTATIQPYNVPSYSTTQQYETLTVYQFINVTQTMTGTYICRATVGKNYVDQNVVVSVDLKSSVGSRL